MAKDSMPLLEMLRKAGIEDGPSFFKAAVETMARLLMEAEVAQQIGADRHERVETRSTQRNGYREPRRWDTPAGTIELRIPKLRAGSYYPSLLEPRRRADKALVSVVQEAYIHGVSTRKVEDLVQALGIESMDKSQVSRMCQELDGVVEAFRNRPLEASYPYLWLDATYLKVRQQSRVINMALVVAVGVNEDGEREVLGLDLGPAEDEAFWLQFLRGLVARGLKGLELVISDAHEGLKKAIASVAGGASWQRCRVHFMRNVLSHVPKTSQPVVSAAVKTIYAQPDADSARAQLHKVADSLEASYPRAARVLRDGGEDTLSYMAFPEEHWRQLHSTNPLERLNKEIKRRSDVVGIFPTRQAVLRLIGSVLMEQDDEWVTGRRYFSQESMRKRRSAADNTAAAQLEDPKVLTVGRRAKEVTSKS